MGSMLWLSVYSYLSLSLPGCGKEVVCWLCVRSILIIVGWTFISDVDTGPSWTPRATSPLNDVTRFFKNAGRHSGDPGSPSVDHRPAEGDFRAESATAGGASVLR